MERRALTAIALVLLAAACGAAHIHPVSPRQYYESGAVSYAAGDTTTALDELDMAIALDPEFSDAHMMRGIILSKLDDYSGALRDFEAAIRIDPDSAKLYYLRAMAAFELGDMQTAADDYERALELGQGLDPAELHFSRGAALGRLGRRAEAVLEYCAAIASDADYEQAYCNRGILLMEQGDLAGARADLDRAVELDPHDAIARFHRGALLQRLGDLAGAERDLSTALLVDPEAADALYGRGTMRIALGDHSGAESDFGRYIALRPDEAQGYASRGIARYGLERHSDAIDDFNEAAERDSSTAELYVFRGLAHRAAGSPRLAIPDLVRSLRLGPTIVSLRRLRLWIAGALLEDDPGNVGRPAVAEDIVGTWDVVAVEVPDDSRLVDWRFDALRSYEFSDDSRVGWGFWGAAVPDSLKSTPASRSADVVWVSGEYALGAGGLLAAREFAWDEPETCWAYVAEPVVPPECGDVIRADDLLLWWKEGDGRVLLLEVLRPRATVD